MITLNVHELPRLRVDLRLVPVTGNCKRIHLAFVLKLPFDDLAGYACEILA